MQPTAHVDTFARDHLPPESQWPDMLLDNPDVAYPARMNCAVELLDRAIEAGHGERPAIWSDVDGKPQATTYAELLALVNRSARVLVEDMGLKPGNRVLLRGPNTLQMAVAFLASLKAGLVVIPTMPLLRAKELKQIADKAQVCAALCDVRLTEELARCMDPAGEFFCEGIKQVRYFHDTAPGTLEALAAGKPADFPACDTASDDVCLIAFTSGTTGTPKGCMHFHRDVIAMCDLFPRHVLQPAADDVFCGTPPLAFTFGLGGLLCFPLRVGASTVLIEKLTPALLLDTIQRFHATIVFTAPTFYRQMAALVAQYDLSSLRKTVSAGEALPQATRDLWRDATGIEMIDGIGGTELIHIFVSSAGADVRPGSIGRAVPGYVVQALDNDLQPVPPGVTGNLAVRGPTGCRYLADERQSVFVRGGWNLPGDAVSIDADGYVFYQARSDDMIVSSGYNIAGPEIETVLMQHPAVAECGVTGVPDEVRGQVVKAFVVLRPGFSAGDALVAELQNFVKNAVAAYKYPRQIAFIDALPRTETGKLKRSALRSM
ncbi:AMP-binding protein [Paraburkholderia silvatlantica]|uniref:2-aminobenzoate-CoA ligase n=1 Tax=Paraburkholderia silvatlantica TaxID=321895 RepID=A0A2U1ACF8_9BURK|nr:AMP-binding protein [Paraburkholderia silvatlantica]MBB2925671.1 2-aminobenzoate-CoA ligase [Paraburkholderia silvatlantica]PVY33212.1 anthranilate--CoA ligase [Paraburkholderia silvatlantica]PXW38104.1 anthranilate--CoA ligase [Paraburkholderia silvatlantica]PYE28080.1 anthranilate--CoA ligase [Paraburkholderia silvatlantica]TDQ92633.1 anthranilate--CoA ligase [Paraburkholderia silvatlantica]